MKKMGGQKGIEINNILTLEFALFIKLAQN